MNGLEFSVARLVLVVDDEPWILALAAAMLKDFGCEVLTAATGAEALTQLGSNGRLEVLVTDINMPGMDGYELAHRATQVREESKVILMSGRHCDGHEFPLIRKPLFQGDLVHAMKRSADRASDPL